MNINVGNWWNYSRGKTPQYVLNILSQNRNKSSTNSAWTTLDYVGFVVEKLAS